MLRNFIAFIEARDIILARYLKTLKVSIASCAAPGLAVFTIVQNSVDFYFITRNKIHSALKIAKISAEWLKTEQNRETG